jgi:plasmid rolling circle replication initiator protein Rep
VQVTVEPVPQLTNAPTSKAWQITAINVDDFKKLPINQENEMAVPEIVRNKTYNRHMDVLVKLGFLIIIFFKKNLQ